MYNEIKNLVMQHIDILNETIAEDNINTSEECILPGILIKIPPSFKLTFNIKDRYFFEIWINDKYSLRRLPNDDYYNPQLMKFLSSWNDFLNWYKFKPLAHKALVIENDLLTCSKYFIECMTDNNMEADIWTGYIMDGYNSLIANFHNKEIQAHYAGWKAAYIFTILINTIEEMLELSLKTMGYQTTILVGNMWATLINQKEIAIIRID